MINCLDNIVGLSNTECICFANISDELRKSPLNLFIDQLEGIDLELIKNSIGCGETLESVFNQIRETAKVILISEFHRKLNATHKTKISTYNGLIGELSYSKQLQISDTWKGIEINPIITSGITMLINAIQIQGIGVGTQQLKVIEKNGLLENEIFSFEFEAVTGINTITLEEPLKLSFIKNGKNSSYRIVYSGIVPYNNEISCGCGNKKEVNKLISIKGINYNNINQDKKEDTAHSMGITIDVSLGCDVDSVVCAATSTNQDFYFSIAQSLWYKMGVLILEKVFNSREINFETLANGEYLYTRKQKFEKIYLDTVNYLAENTAITNSDCFICNEENTIKMGKILI